jgi:hypothetical protein
MLLVASGLSVGALTAQAAPAPSVAVTTAPTGGGGVTVTGTGFAAAYPGVYVGVGPAGAASFYQADTVDTVWVALTNEDGGPADARTAKLNEDGSFTLTLTVPAPTTEVPAYAVYTSKAHGIGINDPSQNSVAPVVFAPAPEPEPEPEPEPAPVVPEVAVTVAPIGGGEVTVSGTGFASGYPGVYVGLAPAGGTGFYAVSASLIDTVWVSTTNVDGGPAGARTGKMNADGSFSVTFTVPAATEAASAYAVYTSKAHGQGFTDPSQNSVTVVTYAPAPAGPTVTVSKTTELDSEGETVTVTGAGFVPDAPGTSGTRPPLAGKFGGSYVVFGKFADAWKPSEGAPSSARKVGNQKWIVHAEDLATIGGEEEGGVIVAPDGTFSAQLRVEKGFGESELGNYGIYTYSGSGAKYAAFETYTAISFAPLATGLTFTTAPADQVTEGGTVTLQAKLDSPVAGTVAFSSGGTTFGSVPTDGSGVATLVVSSLPAGTHQLKAVFTPTDTAAHSSSSATRTFTVTAKPVVVAAGSLTWGVKQSFRDYVTSSIAKGAISTSGVRSAGSAFVFGQASGSTFNGTTGTSNYSGSVRFTGHGGILDLRLANPVVRVDSASSATMLLNVNGSTVPFATLALASGSKRTADGAVTYSGIPATLTAQGAGAFVNGDSQFYPAGTPLDPVTFTIGSPGNAGGGTQTVAAFVAVANGVPPTPPASSGIALQGASADNLMDGDEVTITADGFEPNEQGIKVVIYSDPVILATNATADARGTVTWTGRLPAGLTGEHTLTLQGSVDRGVVLTIADRTMMMTTRMASCVVTDATITWGFKEAFRSYVSGAIAHGEWTVSDGASYETPSFGWSDGAGDYDAASGEGLVAFTGAVTFTGHGGVLNTTVAGPQIRFDDADTATLLLDVSGDTRDGVTVNAPAVEFATIDLTASETKVTDGDYEIVAAPAVLTTAGSDAFGTYGPGTELDPITIAFSTDSGCAAPPVDAGDESAAPIAEAPAGNDWIIWVVIAAVLAALGAAAWVVVARRRSVA